MSGLSSFLLPEKQKNDCRANSSTMQRQPDVGKQGTTRPAGDFLSVLWGNTHLFIGFIFIFLNVHLSLLSWLY